MNLARRRRFLSSGSVDPGSLPFMELRLSGTTLAVADDQNISSWTDSSGNGRTASQASATPQPHTSITGNVNNPDSPTGKKGASFNFGETDRMTGTMPASPGTVVARGFTFYAWIHDSPFATINQTLFQDNNSFRLVYADSSSKIGFADKSGVHASATNFTSGDHFLVWVLYPPIATGVARIYQDGALLLEFSGWDTTNGHGMQDGYTIGANLVATTPYGGILYDFIAFSDAHSAQTIAGVRRWGRGFWGL